MKLIRFAIISIIVCGLVILGITSLLPNTVIVSRAREMSIADSAFDFYVKDVAHWSNWMDDLKQMNKKNDSVFVVGTQTIELVEQQANHVMVKWTAQEQPSFTVQIEKVPLKDGLSVIHWSFEQKLHWYPWEKLQSLLNEKIIGYKMEVDLEHLQEKLQQPIRP
jgi:thiamine kinase-like enzyme